MAGVTAPIAPDPAHDELAALGYTLLNRGKVREVYAAPTGNALLLVASDRISAYDWVLTTPIPDKGKVLTQLSLWWFERLAEVVPNHVIAATGAGIPDVVAGRAMLCEHLTMFPVECVARGYLAGSGLVDYNASGQVCGITLPPGLVDGSRLQEPIFTPATKAEVGDHDINTSYAAVSLLVGDSAASILRDLTIEVYAHGETIARERGIILADTKLEFGISEAGAIVLGDELLTPDSSRFWPADEWEPGHPQPSFDKQFVRDWLTSTASGWDRHSDVPPPTLPTDVIEKTRAKYLEAYERITGSSLD
jgi:phosphoribosylaminoimidazole-succinocarboxamide synthase